MSGWLPVEHYIQEASRRLRCDDPLGGIRRKTSNGAIFPPDRGGFKKESMSAARNGG